MTATTTIKMEGYSSSESERDDPNDEDFDPGDEAPPTLDDEGDYGYINLVDSDTDDD